MFSSLKKGLKLFLILSGLGIPAWSMPEGGIFFRNDEFISSAFSATAEQSWRGVGANFSSQENIHESKVIFDASMLVVPQQPLLNYLNPREAAVVFNNNKQTLFLGRSKKQWSLIDKTWKLGLWQPLFKWNPLQAEEQGLTGFFSEWVAEGELPNTVLLYASNIFIPNQGARFELREGQFEKVNPWFKTPPPQMQLMKVTTPVKYNLIVPEVDEIINQPSAGLRWLIGHADEGLSLALATAKKPSNSLAMTFQGVFDLSTRSGVIDIRPQVYMHTLNSADLSFAQRRWRIYLSGIREEPDAIKADAGWTSPKQEPLTAISAGGEFQLNSWNIRGSIIDCQGGRTYLSGDLAASSQSLSIARVPFQQAWKTELSKEVASKKNGATAISLQSTAGTRGEFSLLGLAVQTYLNKQLSISADADLLKVDENSLAQASEFGQFQDNDRLGLGVRYEF